MRTGTQRRERYHFPTFWNWKQKVITSIQIGREGVTTIESGVAQRSEKSSRS